MRILIEQKHVFFAACLASVDKGIKKSLKQCELY